MSANSDSSNEPYPVDQTGATEADRAQLLRLLDRLSVVDRAAYAKLAADNAALVESLGGADADVRAVRHALSAAKTVAASPQFAAAVAALKQSAGGANPALLFADQAELHGLLTSVTRKLSPQQALELYRSIAPYVVHEVMVTLGGAPRLETVLNVAEHLCSDPVQELLRNAEHARDALLDEIGAALHNAGVRGQMDRPGLESALEQCGAMRHVVAMSNCLKLARSKAG